MKKLKIAVALIIVLVISIPFCYAHELNIITASGQDNLNGYARKDDQVTVEAEVLVKGDVLIDTRQVDFCVGSLCKSAGSCEEGRPVGYDRYFNCFYRETFTNQSDSKNYKVKLYDNTHTEILKTNSVILDIDSAPPKITGFKLNPPATKDITRIEVSAIDFSSVQEYTGYCTGIKKIDFYDKSTGKVLFTKNYGYEMCIADESIEYRHQTTARSEEIEICAIAEDMFGQKSEESCEVFIYDNEAPSISDFHFEDKDENPVSHITNRGSVVELVAQIQDTAEIKSITADLSKITGKSADKNVKHTKKIDDWYYWSDYKITPSTDCNLQITATDLLGNTANQSFSCDVLVDDTAPEVQDMTTSYVDVDGNFIVAPETVVTADFIEQGVGLYKKNVYLDLSEIGLDSRQADSCEKNSDNTWTCVWNGITPVKGEGDYQIRISKAEDDLGNKLAQTARLDVEVFSKAPSVYQVSHYPVGLTSADLLEFTFRIKDSKTEPSAYVNASSISEEGIVQASCDSVGSDEWECHASVGSLSQTYVKDWVVFYTTSGRSRQEVRYEITVYEIEPAEGIDFYKVQTVNTIPSKGFDKRVVYNIDYPVYLEPVLKLKNPMPEMSIIDKSFICAGDDVTFDYSNENSDSPFIIVRSTAAVADRTAPVKVSCTVTLTVRQGQRVFSSQEKETFEKEIPVYNNPLGGVGENAQAQIDQINARIHSIRNSVSKLSNINNIFAGIVGAAQTVAQANSVSSYLGAVFWGISVVLYEVLRALGEEKSCKTIYGCIIFGIQKFFWKGIACGALYPSQESFLDYIWTPGYVGSEILDVQSWNVALQKITSTLIKVTSIIYSCQICDFSTSLSAGIKTSVYGDTTFNIGGNKGKPTQVEQFLIYDWDPYKSIHIATACLCLPGVVYNMRKEEQINCIYRNCVQQNAEKGLPFDNCAQTFKELNCLYVDSAAWRAAGGTPLLAALFSELLPGIFEQIVVIVAGRIWSITCDPYCGLYNAAKHKSDVQAGGELSGACGDYALRPFEDRDATAYPDKCDDDPSKDWEIPLCRVWGATQVLTETNFFSNNKFQWQKYMAELEGEDYCD